MKISAAQHIFVTGACGAGKSTLARALSRQLQLPLHRLDDDSDFRQLVENEPPEAYRWTEPRRYARFQALRRQLVQEAVKLPQSHIIEGTHILAVPKLTTGHRRILVDTPLYQIIRQSLARDRARYAEEPARYATRNAGAPGSVAARQRAARTRQIYEGLLECLLILYTDLDGSWFLATLGDVGNMSTSMWEIEKLPLRNDAVFPPLLWTGKWCKPPKPPRFTKSGQEPGSLCKVSG